MKKYFLGIDCSTQSLTSLLIEENNKNIDFLHSINFDKDLPLYKTENGVLFLDEKTVHSPPLMWVEALELIFHFMEMEGIDFKGIRAISGSGQQHGTVYLKGIFDKKLGSLDPNQPLAKQLEYTLTRETSPIWMDSSTTIQCEEIRQALGGMEETIKITGSNTFERFSGPQIRKFYQQEPEKYIDTGVIHLVSSFLASILLGKSAPIDHGDGAGMNLMNIREKKWDERALKATAPDLKSLLPELCSPYKIIGTISPYFIKKYGFDPETLLIAWSGDNPNSLIGVGLINKGKAAVSLGTSDTYFSYLKHLYLDLSGEGHVFGAPTGEYMSLICYKNGSLTREYIKNLLGLNWKEFSERLRNSSPGNNGKIMLPYYLPEIVPLVLDPEIKRFGFDKDDVIGNIRGVIEGQFLSMKLHSQWIAEFPEEIYVTGGASANEDIIQVLADIFGVKVKKFEITNSAVFGAALRSLYSYYQSTNNIKNWENIADDFLKKYLIKTVLPRKNYEQLYKDMLKLYEKCENFILHGGINPEPIRKQFISKYF